MEDNLLRCYHLEGASSISAILGIVLPGHTTIVGFLPWGIVHVQVKNRFLFPNARQTTGTKA